MSLYGSRCNLCQKLATYWLMVAFLCPLTGHAGTSLIICVTHSHVEVSSGVVKPRILSAVGTAHPMGVMTFV